MAQGRVVVARALECVARTLADLNGSDGVTRVHVAEALAYRRIVPGRNALLMGA